MQTSNTTASPTASSANAKRLLNRSRKNSEMPDPASVGGDKVSTGKNSDNEGKSSTLLGQFHHLPHYYQLYEVVKGVFSNYKVWMLPSFGVALKALDRGKLSFPSSNWTVVHLLAWSFNCTLLLSDVHIISIHVTNCITFLGKPKISWWWKVRQISKDHANGICNVAGNCHVRWHRKGKQSHTDACMLKLWN